MTSLFGQLIMDSEKEKQNTSTKYICTICTKTFTTKSNINEHMKRIHKQFKKNTKLSLKCPLCTMLLENYSELDKHLTSIHNEFLKKEEYSFETIEKFNAWKLEIEKLCFFKLMNSRKVKDRKIVKYICHRSGTYTPRVQTRKKALKVKGSNKIGSNCPARLVVTISHKDRVKVDYFSTHIGHDLEVGRVNLTYNERQNIAVKLLQGIPSQRIIQDIADEFSSNNRLSYTTVHDIHNIKRSFNIQSNVIFHEEDTNSNASDLEHITGHLQGLAEVKNLELATETVLQELDNLKKLVVLNGMSSEVISYVRKNVSTVSRGIHAIINSSNTVYTPFKLIASCSDPHNKKIEHQNCRLPSLHKLKQKTKAKEIPKETE
ncbi:unnamed protein product [Psylliodes chrysocephalus]|uniref:C2H2-type domain-containing protein n=1 Tax=Psylliodes chrysocephalus TaxID=3402493 RepID=A0A9P0CZB6_9CUCU|nr:unnamed protein product [Psylliodes chrysocephala]